MGLSSVLSEARSFFSIHARAHGNTHTHCARFRFYSLFGHISCLSLVVGSAGGIEIFFFVTVQLRRVAEEARTSGSKQGRKPKALRLHQEEEIDGRSKGFLLGVVYAVVPWTTLEGVRCV